MYRSEKMGGRWGILYEPGGKCFSCGEDSIITLDVNELFVISCIRCGFTLRLGGKPGRLELNK